MQLLSHMLQPPQPQQWQHQHTQLLSHMQPLQPQQWQHQHTQLLYHMQPPQPQQWQPQPTLVRMAMEDSQPPTEAMEATDTEDSHMALCSEALVEGSLSAL